MNIMYMHTGMRARMCKERYSLIPCSTLGPIIKRRLIDRECLSSLSKPAERANSHVGH